MAYLEILAELERRQARYLIVGGVAVNLHGVPRMTADLDLLIDFEPENALRVVESLTSLGYLSRVPVPPKLLADPEARRTWRDEKNMLVFSFYHPRRPYELVDILTESPVDYTDAVRREQRLDAGGIVVHVAGIEDLIRMKSHAGRAQDLSDIEALQKRSKVGGTES